MVSCFWLSFSFSGQEGVCSLRGDSEAAGRDDSSEQGAGVTAVHSANRPQREGVCVQNLVNLQALRGQGSVCGGTLGCSLIRFDEGLTLETPAIYFWFTD